MTTIDASSAAALQASTASPSAAAGPPDQMGKDTFLKLLVAQLKYQDPMNPAEGSEFLAQTAQFSMVEKLEEISKQGAEALTSTRNLTAAGMIGRQVTYQGADGLPATGVVTSTRHQITGPVLVVGGKEVPLASVTEVGAPTATSAPTAPAAPAPAAPPAAATPAAEAPAATSPAATAPGATAPAAMPGATAPLTAPAAAVPPVAAPSTEPDPGDEPSTPAPGAPAGATS